LGRIREIRETREKGFRIKPIFSFSKNDIGFLFGESWVNLDDRGDWGNWGLKSDKNFCFFLREKSGRFFRFGV
jgi:hypothetical protein